MESQLVSVRKGAWAPEEDILLRRCVLQYGEGQWHLIPERAGLKRCRKSCRLRWLNYLKPSIKRGVFQEDEVDLIIRLHRLLGNRWSLIAGRIPGRTANDIKNYWNSCLCKKVGVRGEVAGNINKRNTVDSAVVKSKASDLPQKQYPLGRSRPPPRPAHFTEATGGSCHEIFRPQPRTLSEGTICLPEIIACNEFLPGGQCFPPKDDRPESEQDPMAWTRLLLEDNENDEGQRQHEEREEKVAIPVREEEDILDWIPQTDGEVERGWWLLGWEDVLCDTNLTSETCRG
ncbi:unnamed protein product [Spirodela intermedia]|uniref:Uncharacterized protein n=1 Tax=Spirodela intermedia TaxID=51605 RepID=A0A7I8KWR4_SPIIN|nr:unnamed protein product [Spirodela intermedia]